MQFASAELSAKQWWDVLGDVFAGPGGLDVALLGPSVVGRRALGFAVLALGLRDESGAPLFERVVLITPPTRVAAEEAPGMLRTALVRAGTPEPALDEQLARVEWRGLTTFDAAELVALVTELDGRVAVHVDDASELRWPDRADAGGDRELELELELGERDRWTAHLARTAAELAGVIRARATYVLLDTGRFAPASEAARRALDAIDGGQVAATLDDARSSMALTERALAVDEAGGDAAMLAALAAIDRAAPPLPPMIAAVLRAVVVRGGGFAHTAWTILRPHWRELVEQAGTDTRVALARIACEGGAEEEAARMLGSLDVDDATADELALALAVAGACRAADVEERVVHRLAAVYPRSPACVAHVAWRAIARGDLDGLERLLADPTIAPSLADRDVLADVARSVRAHGDDRLAGADELVARHPAHADRLRLALADDAAGRGAVAQALVLTASVDHDSPDAAVAARRTLDVLGPLLDQRGRGGDPVISDEDLPVIVATALAQIARNPRAPRLRLELARLLSDEHAGDRGVALLAHLLLTRARAPQVVPPMIGERASDDELERFLVDCEHLVQRGELRMLGRGQLADTIDAAMAARIVARLPEVLEEALARVKTGGDLGPVTALLHGALLACNRAEQSRDGLALVHAVAAQLAALGHPVVARDLVEHGLSLAGAAPASLRVAWLAHADVLHRTGDPHAALTGALLALSFPAVTLLSSEAWQEGATLSRLLRDLGLFDEALHVLDTAAGFLGDRAAQEPMATRLATARRLIEERRRTTAGAAPAPT